MVEYITISGFILVCTVIFYSLLKEKDALAWGQMLFLLLTVIYFLRNSFITSVAIFIILRLFCFGKSLIGKVGLFLLALPLVPVSISWVIPFPQSEQLFTLTYPRLLSLSILIPILLRKIIFTPGKKISSRIDKYIVISFLINFLLTFRGSNLTNGIRDGLHLFLDLIVPYFAISLAIKEKDDFERLWKPMVFMASILALVSFFEFFRHWMLYTRLLDLYSAGGFGYNLRFGFLRAGGPFLINIAFGVYFCFMLTILSYFKYSNSKFPRYLKFFIPLFLGAMFCTLSHGPVLGFFLALLCFFLSGKVSPKMLAGLLLILFILFVGYQFSDLSLESSTINAETKASFVYRQKLWNNSMKVIDKHPWFGNIGYMAEPEIQEMALYGGSVGEGRVDIVNSYLGIVLQYGLIGLFSFLSIFLSIYANFGRLFYKIIREEDKETKFIARMLFSITFAYMIMIFNVSLISYLPFYLWILFAFCSAFINMHSQKKKPEFSY